MKRSRAVLLVVLALASSAPAAWATGTSPVFVDLLAAMPILEPGMTQIGLAWTAAGVGVSIGRVVGSNLLVRGQADMSGRYDLALRVLAPLEIAPAFLAVEVAPGRLTGLMTLFFGPVSMDLGRSWFNPERWLLIQCVVHPRLTLVAGGWQEAGVIRPYVGWRMFPAATAQWEIDMLFGGAGVRLSVGGAL
jgi:hypothetical protein